MHEPSEPTDSASASSGQPRRIPPPTRDPLPETSRTLPRVHTLVRDSLTSAVNAFGLFRQYWHRPSYDPDSFLKVADLASRPAVHADEGEDVEDDHVLYPPPWPFENITVYRLMSWLNNGKTMKSEEEVDALVKDVMEAPDFDISHLKGFSASRENARLTRAIAEARESGKASALLKRFDNSPLHIKVPSGKAGVPAADFPLPDLLHMKLTDVIKGAFQDSLAQHLHYSPFELHHTSSGDPKDSERVHGELYTSQAFLDAHNDVQHHASLPPDDPSCKRERLVAALQFASDAMHLADFGAAKAWPIYVMLGNISKYIRAVPTSGALYHLAYIPSFPASFPAFAEQNHAKWKTQQKDITVHCHRELMHAVWDTLLDEEFVHAYKYGMVIRCLDGVERRVYPRIFTYSADYPEKVLLASIRDGGSCPCPRCLVHKSKLDQLGLRRDMATRVNAARTYLSHAVSVARRAIYEFAHPIGGTLVQTLLKPFSAVPTENAFPKKLGDDFNPSEMLVVDLMHEFELGVWKAIFTHLIRILYAADPRDANYEIRYKKIEAFSLGTIRKFATKENVSEMKKLAARDFEDLLQCALPCFEGLLPPELDIKLRQLLYRMAEWHATAKLRMHTDTTLALLEELTTEFGKLAREFEQLSSSHYTTVETPKEAAARARRELSRVAAAKGQPKPTGADVAAAPKTRKPKKLNLATYKFHALGDYVTTIKRYGTTDSYTTQTSELAHRVIKRLYQLTNKRDAMKQIAQKYTRHEFFHQQEEHELDELAKMPSELPYSIAESRKHNFSLASLSKQHPHDPNFTPKLKDHLLGRLLHRKFDGDDFDFTEADRRTVQIKNERIYTSQVLRVNYTTYDVRRGSDHINAHRREFIMTPSPEEGENVHPYWYAQVLGVYRADVRHTGTQSEDFNFHEMKFLFVRWLGREPGYRWGRRFTRLPKVGFVPEDQPDAFGFLDPALVIRGAHLIPSFVNGRGTVNLRAGPSVARAEGEEDDWINYYVNIFADRDMVMRYLGGGIGHVRTSQPRDATTAAAPVEDDDDPTDVGDLSSTGTDLTAYQEVEDGTDLVDDGVGIDEVDEEEDWDGNEDEDEDEGELDADDDYLP
ncbi:hypothetical protein GGF50DRAFT_67162 [Schizophyllum commune]